MRTMHAFVMWMGFGLLLISQAVGCTRLRFVVDAVPAEESITETTVLDDQPSNFLSTTSRKIALIDVQGLIVDARSNQFLSSGENPVDRFAESLDRAAGDADVKAVIIRLNSPGGAVTASDVMYRLVQRFKEDTRKPVVMLMSDVAASGAFYLSCAGDYVIAHPTTVTGVDRGDHPDGELLRGDGAHRHPRRRHHQRREQGDGLAVRTHAGLAPRAAAGHRG
jgi:hypothetical protein